MGETLELVSVFKWQYVVKTQNTTKSLSSFTRKQELKYLSGLVANVFFLQYYCIYTPAKLLNDQVVGKLSRAV